MNRAMNLEALSRPSRAVPMAAAGLLFITGLFGALNEAWGYGLMLVATIALLLGICAFGLFVLTQEFDTASLVRTYKGLLVFGGWLYVLGVSALSGYFVFEALHGRMELRWILFGPVVLACVVVLDVGLYRLLIAKNLPTWQRFGNLITRADSDPGRMRKALVDDVILHRSLFDVSAFRWFKHTLIFWGFSVMFAVEIVAVFVREGLPAFGADDIWEDLGHPLRMAFDFAYDFTGLMVLIGCLLALLWRVKVQGTAEQKFTDTPTAVFLFFVVVSGFLLEGARIAAEDGLTTNVASFVGVLFARLFEVGSDTYDRIHAPLWYIHVFGSCAFIAYVPVKRLVHSCATPMGRLMNSQTGLLAKKKEAALRGMLVGKAPE
ncbi:MAG: respiratory nitrate reductase subunit gamma [Alphaproteobacteria bacterium]|nr:respiratory nitrate reductase subunit gamma [Alphaproteobacteria bacterium]